MTSLIFNYCFPLADGANPAPLPNKEAPQKNTAIDLEFYGWFQTILNKFSKKNNYFFKFLMGLENNKKLFFLGLLQLTILSIPITFLSILSMIFNRGSTMQVILKKI